MRTRKYKPIFGQKHIEYIRACRSNMYNIAEGAIRAGKTVDNVFAFCTELETCPDKIHLASASTGPTAKLNIGDCNGMGIEAQFRGRCTWGKYKGNECMKVQTKTGLKIVIFAGAGKADSFKRIRGNSYGMWIATEINLHHDEFIKEAFNRTVAAKLRKFFWDLNPSSPSADIYTQYIDKYREKQEAGEMPGGCNYQKFLLTDNATIPQYRIDEIIAQYTPGTVWYRRDILGERCVAEGAIYTPWVDDAKRFIKHVERSEIEYASIGWDFGGNGSASAGVCVGVLKGYKGIAVLREYYQKGVITPEKQEAAFVSFVRSCREEYNVYEARCDSAEQTLIAGFKAAAVKERLPVDIKNAIKGEIMNRVRFALRCMGRGAFFVDPGCKHVQEALFAAVYDPKHVTQDVRLDNGTTNIDSLDAMEYAYEPVMGDIIRMSGVRH